MTLAKVRESVGGDLRFDIGWFHFQSAGIVGLGLGQVGNLEYNFLKETGLNAF